MLVSSIFEFRSPCRTPVSLRFLLFLYKSYVYNLTLIPTLGPYIMESLQAYLDLRAFLLPEISAIKN